MRRACILLALGTLPVSVSASERYVTILGTDSCSNWTAARKQELDPDPIRHWEALLNKYWVLGFLSGLTLSGDGQDLLADVDLALISEWTDQYCKSHPDDSLAEAGRQLHLKLQNVLAQ